jgi:4-amino-4-deoxy-L-arabinose transferase-like glycosyltransferase
MALDHNLRVLTAISHSRQFLVLILFAGVGLLFALGRSEWDPKRKAEFSLCGWLAIGLGIFLATVRLTFYQYFVLLIPFLSILASVGIMATAYWLRRPERPAWLVPGVLLLFVAGIPSWLWRERNHLHWPQIEGVAKTVNHVTPEDGWIWAHETIYFAAQRTPPSGFEHSDAHKLQLSLVDSADLHVVSRADAYHWAATGRFATVVTCYMINGWPDATGIQEVYANRTTVNGCNIFWSKNFRLSSQ